VKKHGKKTSKTFAANQVIHLFGRQSDENIPKLMAWVDRYDKKNEFVNQRNAVRRAVENPQSNWYRLIKSLWTDIDDGQRRTLV
jgi:hypothetical protein